MRRSADAYKAPVFAGAFSFSVRYGRGRPGYQHGSIRDSANDSGRRGIGKITFALDKGDFPNEILPKPTYQIPL